MPNHPPLFLWRAATLPQPGPKEGKPPRTSVLLDLILYLPVFTASSALKFCVFSLLGFGNASVFVTYIFVALVQSCVTVMLSALTSVKFYW